MCTYPHISLRHLRPLSKILLPLVLLVQAHIRYWIRAQKRLLGVVNLKGSCGIDEAPRQALIGMQVLLEWGPDWTLRPRFRILPTRFLDRCEMTIANIDVTPVVETEFRKQMQDSLRAALRTLDPSLNAIQRQAQQTWSLLELTGDLAGTAEMRASVAYAAQHRKLEIQDLTFDYAAEDSTMGVLAKAFHEHIRQALEEAANQALEQHLDLLGERPGTVLKKIAPAGVTLDMSALQLSSVQIRIEKQGIRVDGTATGSVRLVLV